MKKKKILKYLLVAILTALVIGSIYCLIKYFKTGNQYINIANSEKYFLGSDLEANIEITSEKFLEKGKVNVKLLDSEQKKVKGAKGKYLIDESGLANISLKIPENIEAGKYFLDITAKTNLGKDNAQKAIIIQNGNEANINVILDKGIYKPGDEVNFRTLLTHAENDIPIQENVKISIYDGNENRVFIKEASTSDYGILSGTFKLADEVNSGNYKLKVETKGQEYVKIFKVNPYVTPKFEVSIKSDKDAYLVGDTAKITVNAKYFFGEFVENANAIFTVNEEKFEGTTDSQGNYIIEYPVNKAGKILVEGTVEDTSNYLIESKTCLYASEDIFDIEILPVYGDIISNIDNDIYVFTKKADGTGIKTYITVTFDKIKRQVITDENGVGKFTLTSSDIANISSADLKISAEDMEKNEVSKKIRMGINSNYGTAISTDKVKYNVGDKIKLKINSSNNSENLIYVCKNDKVLKMITTMEDELELDLEDTYGLVDICALSSKSHQRAKRTIFIKPSKALNIQVNTDAEEYKPSDTMKLSLDLKDENDASIDAAMLVSILDEAVLSLASNDISIDNIKLALSNIKFSEDLDAATLYSNIIDDASETTLMGLLLKQSSSINMIQKSKLYPETTKGVYLSIFTIQIIIVVISACIIAIVKSKKAKKILVHLFAISVILIILFATFFTLIYDETSLSEVEIFILITIVTLIIYILYLYKKKEYLAEFGIYYGILGLIATIVISLAYDLFYDSEIYLLLLILVIPVILAITVLIERAGKNVQRFKRLLLKALKAEILIIVTIIIFEEQFLIVTFIVDYIIENIILAKKIKKPKNIQLDSDFNLGVGVAITSVIILIVLIIGIIKIISSFSSNIGDVSVKSSNRSNNWDLDVFDSQTTTNSGRSSGVFGDSWENIGSVLDEANSSADIDGASSLSSLIEAGTDFIDKGKNIISKNEKEENIEFKEEKVSSQDEHIRNVFLESLCFIPELVSENGKAEKDIKLSDNITTWQIQVVGNTKDGRVGSSSNTFKVFKEFFIDYSMPTNTIVGDKISIPVTVYNYTEGAITVNLNVVENDWCTIGNYEKQVTLTEKGTKLIYVPIEILKAGENILRVESTANELTDIVEKKMTTEENGIKISNVVASGTFEDKLDLDVLYLQNYKEGTGKLRIKLYSTAMSQNIEGLENIFKMPTGCFEQVSSSLYPDILVLKYLEDFKGKDIDENLKQKALNYIETGYQKLLTYQVDGEKGAYSLYGHKPGEIVITSYGLMEFADLSTVYNVDEKVINDMKEYIFSKQNSVTGTFKLDDGYLHGIVDNTDDLTLNAYIAWTVSEVFPEEEKLQKTVKYLEDNLDKIEDNYTLALVANVFANTKSKKTDIVIKKLLKNTETNNEKTYLSSTVRDYYGTYGRYQNLQTTALTSLAFTKTNTNSKTNLELINYIISCKDPNGTWGTTQGTIFALKALLAYEGKTTVNKQEVKLKLNDESKVINIEKNNLDIYEEVFENVSKENKFNIDIEKGKLYYELIQEYYIDYEDYNKEEDKLAVSYTINQTANVNDEITQNIRIENTYDDILVNGMIEIKIPQGCSVKEESLMMLETNKLIEKYEYNYGKIYLYIRNMEKSQYKDLIIKYKADYPAEIKGGSVRIYDYYNPDIQAIAMPTQITIK